MENEEVNARGNNPPVASKGRFALNTLKNTRNTLAKVIREFEAGKMDAVKFKGLVYGISQLAAIFRMEAEIRQEERLEAVERALAELRGGATQKKITSE